MAIFGIPVIPRLSEMAKFLASIRLPRHSVSPNRSGTAVLLQLRRFQSPPASRGCLLFASALEDAGAEAEELCARCNRRFCLLDSAQRLSGAVESAVLGQSLDSGHQTHELFNLATFTVVGLTAHYSSTRQHRSGRDPGEGGNSLLPLELETVTWTDWQRRLCDGLLGAVKEVWDMDALQPSTVSTVSTISTIGGTGNPAGSSSSAATPTPSNPSSTSTVSTVSTVSTMGGSDLAADVLYAFFLLHSRVEIPVEPRGDPTFLPPIE